MAVKPQTVSQVLPTAIVIPRLAVSEDLKNLLTERAANAYRRYHGDFDTEPFAVMMAPVRARAAAELYVSEKEFETALPAFRKVLRDGNLRKSINALRRNLTSDASPPFPQMRSLFCYGDPNSNGLEAGSPDEVKRRQEYEDLWDAKFSAGRLEELLEQWQSLMDELHRLSGTGRTPIVTELKFVSRLAHYWAGELKCKLYSARAHSYFGPVENKQTGAFANFVRAAADIIPMPYRPSSWDHAIRTVIETREN